MRSILRACLLTATACLCAQTGNQAPPEPAIRVNVNLVQLDVTVMDKQGRRIPGLTAADFEVLQDGKKQAVTSALWIGRRDQSPKGSSPGEGVPSVPLSRQPTKQEVRRTVAILVDDLSLAMPSVYYTREAIRKFVETNVEDGDLVALFRTSASMSFLQQFTSDRRALLAALGRTTFRSMNQVDSLAALSDNPLENSSDPTIAQMALEQRLRDEVHNRERQDMITAGMLGSMQYLIQGLREMPGRKSLILFSESVQLWDAPQSLFNPEMTSSMQMNPGAQGGDRYRTRVALRNATDLANRSGVVLYAIDPRGVQTLGLTAQDAPSNDPRRMLGALNQRSFEFTSSQSGMSIMAEETGGLFFKGTNDITAALRDALTDQEEYYLIGFQPDDDSFEKVRGAAKLHKLQVRIKRPGLKVRYRKGYLGIPDSERLPKPASSLLAAMMSPFRASDVPIRLTPLMRQVETDGEARGKDVPRAMVRTLLHMDASKLSFQDQPAAEDDTNKAPWKSTKVDFALFLFDQDNQIAARMAHTQEIKLRGNSLERAMQDGLVQQLELAIAEPGSYQLRAAIVDQASGLAGSAAQFIQIPDLGKRQLASSDIVLSAESWAKNEDDRGSPARRSFLPGEKINYTILIYNALVSPVTKTPKLETQVVLYRNAQVVYRGPKRALAPPAPAANANLTLSGSLTLGKDLTPGDYALEIGVRDTLAPKKIQFAVRASDFEVR